MKRRQRRPVLDISGEESGSPRRRWQNKYQQIAVDHPEQSELPNNPLASLLGQYDSDSETEESKQDANKLDDQVNDFFKEIQLIAPEPPKPNIAGKQSTPIATRRKLTTTNQQQSLWQECFDESTGYPYYWHTETNEVTWEMPPEVKLLRENTQFGSTMRVSQAAQWAGYSSNTYPELQTNIPDGMIPKEVVARNRNRQVGKQRNEHRYRNERYSPKRVGMDDESDDGKIEMITSFGDEESETDISDGESSIKDKFNDSSSVKSRVKSQITSMDSSIKRKANDSSGKFEIGPSLPSGVIPMIHGPENADISLHDERTGLEKSELQKTSNSTLSGKKFPDPEKSIQKSHNSDEEDILKRLKGQAKLLQSLGGEVPELVETLIKDEPANIVSQVESEAPIDHKPCTARLDDEEMHKSARIETNQSAFPFASGAEFKVSLVAGYSDDSDAEDDASPKGIKAKTLFPISEYKDPIKSSIRDPLKMDSKASETNESLIVSHDSAAKKVEVKRTETNVTRIFEYSIDSTERSESGMLLEEMKELNEKSEHEKAENFGGEEAEVQSTVGKPNKFLENLEIPSKAFQRKKRIAFDVTPSRNRPDIPSRSKQGDAESAQTTKTEGAGQLSAPTIPNVFECRGLGFKEEQQPPLSEVSETDVEKPERPSCNPVTSGNNSSSGISFVKGETINTKAEESVKSDEKTEEQKSDLKLLTGTIMEKLKFLSEGSQPASAVQVMAIQLQTLLGAWEAGDLKENYFCNWLMGTGRELSRLEKAAAPPGWDCQWDRSHKRYYYRNTTSGAAQWTYPEVDVIGGTEEMDLCTTPPPPDLEESSLIEQAEVEEQASKEEPVAARIPSTEQYVENAEQDSKELKVPPPPQISNPSPPPPPRIFAEDLKKGKKRTTSSKEMHSERKREKMERKVTKPTSPVENSVNPPLPPSPPKPAQPPLPPQPPLVPNPPNSEPLPPGVDPPDMPYPIAPSAIDPSVLYAATSSHQTNPIYAATLADSAVSIIDHHAALIQGQLMHYPTYHQHLHNQQAIIAAANRLAGQDAVQFMIADYPRVYTGSQVIAKPPVKVQQPQRQDSSLGSALNSFYNDIASIEKSNTELDSEQQEEQIDSLPSPQQQIATEQEQAIVADSISKEKKKKKIKLGVSKKQKEMSSMVAKWQKAQQHFED